MNKNFITVFMFLILSTLLVVTGCGKKDDVTTVSKGEVNLFSMVPENAAGVFSLNIKKLTSMDFFDKVVQDMDKENADKPGKVFKNYQDFIDKTGINPKTDMKAVVVGMFGEMAGPMNGEPDMIFLANLNFDRNKILQLLKEHGADFTEEAYKKMTLFKIKDEKEKDMAFSFISDEVIAGGTPKILKQVIDLKEGAGKNILSNTKMKEYMGKFASGSIVSFAFSLPEEAKKVHDSGMFKMDLTKAESIIGNIGYENKALGFKLSMISLNEEANQQMVSTLNSLKMMAGAGGPEVAEIVNNLTLKATPESVDLEVNIPFDLLEKLKNKFAMKAAPPAEEPSTDEEKPTESE